MGADHGRGCLGASPAADHGGLGRGSSVHGSAHGGGAAQHLDVMLLDSQALEGCAHRSSALKHPSTKAHPCSTPQEPSTLAPYHPCCPHPLHLSHLGSTPPSHAPEPSTEAAQPPSAAKPILSGAPDQRSPCYQHSPSPASPSHPRPHQAHVVLYPDTRQLCPRHVHRLCWW